MLEQNDIEGAFVILAKAATLVLEKMPTHRDYHTMLTAAQRNNLTLVCRPLSRPTSCRLTELYRTAKISWIT